MMMNSIPKPSSTTSLEIAETPKLPLEIIGKILLNFNDDERLEEMKKVRLISPRWYKGVQDLFQDEFSQKYLTHFDGSKQTFASSRSFGCNIFGDYKLNYTTLRISNSDQHLIETFMARLITTNLQILELQNNLLNLEEIIDILGKFQNLLHFKYIQSSEDIEMADKISTLFPNYEEILPADLKNIEALVEKKENFLPKLVTFEVNLIHMKILNFLSYIISCSECALESFLVQMDFEGIKSSSISQITKIPLPELEEFNFSPNLWYLDRSPLAIKSFDYFDKFSKSLKKIDISVDKSKAPLILQEQDNHTHLRLEYVDFKFALDEIMVDLFNSEKLENFKAIEELILSLSTAPCNKLVYKETQNKLITLLNGQTSLKKCQIFMIQDLSHIENGLNSTRDFVARLKNSCSDFQFGFRVDRMNEQCIRTLVEFSENLTKIQLEHYPNSLPLSHEEIPKFPKCLEMKYTMSWDINEPTFQIPPIVEKFPNLEKLTFIDTDFNMVPMTNEEVQLIIRQYKNLKELHLINCSKGLRDYGLTGLTEEALRIRSTNPDLPIQPEEQIGLPISHLQSLESLAICVRVRGKWIPPPPPEISDLTAKFGFEGMKKLRKIQLMNTKITREGFRILKEKTGSKNLLVIHENMKIV